MIPAHPSPLPSHNAISAERAAPERQATPPLSSGKPHHRQKHTFPEPQSLTATRSADSQHAAAALSPGDGGSCAPGARTLRRVRAGRSATRAAVLLGLVCFSGGGCGCGDDAGALAAEQQQRGRRLLGHCRGCRGGEMDLPTAQASSLASPSFIARLSNTHTHTRAHTLTHAHTRAHIHTHTHTRARAHTHTYTLTHTHAHTRAHIHTHTHTRAHIHTHTHTHTRLLVASCSTWPPAAADAAFSSLRAPSCAGSSKRCDRSAAAHGRPWP